ncbi:MAG: CHAT domain-containing protein [Flavobacteriales bacterium]|nr:CHAT domain-containing protein [Flavobacteriales bacterium]
MPSLSAFRHNCGPVRGDGTRTSQGVLALAPGFSDREKQRYLAEVLDTGAVDRDFLNYVRQPFAVNTARGLARTLHATVLLESDANEAEFRERAEQFGILHLGTHAEMNATSPMYSRLVLSKSGSTTDAESDGYLHAYEIMRAGPEGTTRGAFRLRDGHRSYR